MPRPPDPYVAFRFLVELGGVEVGGFSQVAGLARETAVEEYREGGRNDFVHRLVTGHRYPPLVLKHGLGDAVDLWSWHQRVIEGSFERRDLTVVVRDARAQEKRRWVFSGAYPSKWTGSDLDGASAAILVESVEFAHNGMRAG